MVEFPSGQTSTAGSPDPAAQILYANTGEMDEITNPVELHFSHLSAYLHIRITNADLSGGAIVQAVNITNDARFLAGRIFYNLESGEYTSGSVFNTISVNTSTLADVWCAVCPVDLSDGQLTIEVVTDKGTLTKTVKMPASANLTRGKIARFTVDMDGIERIAPVVYNAVTNISQLNVGDSVIIAAAGDDQAYALSTGQNTNNRSAAGVTKTESQIINPTSSVEIFELEDGIIPGHFAFRATSAENPGYIYAANPESSGDNLLRTKATMDNSASWAVTVQNVTVSGTTWNNATIMFADIPSSGRGLIRFNANDRLFTAYGSGSKQQAVRLYRLNEAAVSHFNVTLPEGKAVVGTDDVQVPIYVFGNVAWTASLTGDGASLSADSGSGNAILTLTVPKTYADKDYVVTVSTTEAVATQSYTLNVHHKNAYSFTLSKDKNLGSNGSYAGNCDVTIDGIKWNVTGVSNSSTYDGWRMGGNQTATFDNEDRAVYSKTAIPAQVTKVTVKTNSNANITVNSFTVSAHTSAGDAASGSNPIGSVSVAFGTGEKDFVVPNGQDWSGCYLRIAYNLTKTDTTGNGYVQFGGMTIWGITSD